MKKISKIMFITMFLNILIIGKVKAADITCNLNDVVNNNDTSMYNTCQVVTINNLDNMSSISRFSSLTTYVFDGLTINDVSFINNYDIRTIKFDNCRVNLNNFNGKNQRIYFNNTKVTNDDFSGLSNSDSINYFSYNGYINDINKLSALSRVRNLKAIQLDLKGKIYDYSVIKQIPNITKLTLGNEQNYTEDIINYASSNGLELSHLVDRNYTTSELLNYREQIDAFYNSLNLDGMSDIQKIITISNAVNNKLTYNLSAADKNISHFKNFLDGQGVCGDYAMLTEYFLNKAGFMAYYVVGKTYYDSNLGINTTHAWNEVFYNGKWYAIDNTWTDGTTITEDGVNSGAYDYFMVDPKGSRFYDSRGAHNPQYYYEDVGDFAFTYSYNVNGGNSKSSDKVPVGTNFTPTSPTRSGYTFDGWYTNSALTTSYNSNDYVNHDITLYAKWKEGSTTPTNPDKPTDPEIPTEPDNPTNPDNPTDSDKIPTIIARFTFTNNSIKVNADTITNNAAAISSYKYSKDGGKTWETSDSNIYTFSNLKSSTSYEMQVKAIDVNNKETNIVKWTVITLASDDPTEKEDNPTNPDDSNPTNPDDKNEDNTPVNPPNNNNNSNNNVENPSTGAFVNIFIFAIGALIALSLIMISNKNDKFFKI